MMPGFALYVYKTLVVHFWACAMSLNSAWARETGRSPNRRFEFHKRSELFIRTHNETLSVVAMCVSNEGARFGFAPATLSQLREAYRGTGRLVTDHLSLITWE
jgi:hypothetical protein